MTPSIIETTGKEVIPDAGNGLENVRRTADWDLRSGPKNYLVLVGAQIASSLLSFAAVWLVTRTLGTEGYGGITAIFAAVQVGTVGLQWSVYALNRFGCEEFVRTGKITNAFWTRTLIFAVNLLLLLIVTPWWLPRLSEWLKIPLQAGSLIIAYLILTALWMHIQQALMAAKLMRHQGILIAAERLIIVLILIPLILTGKASLYTIVIAYCAGSLGAILLGVGWLRKMIRMPIAFSNQMFKQMIRFSLPLIPFSLIAYLSTNYLDAFFITHYLSLTDLGVYNVAYLLSGTVMQVITLGSGLLLPWFVTLQVNGQEKRIESYLRDIVPFLALFWSLGCSVFAVAGNHLIPIVLGSNYQGATDLLWPLMAAASIAGPGLLGYGAFSSASSVTNIVSVTAVLSAIANISLNALLVPSYGLSGCAWATVGAYAVSLIVWKMLIAKRLPSVNSLSLVATLPALLGAAFATWRHEDVTALLISLTVFVVISVSCWKSIVIGFNGLQAAGIKVHILKYFVVKGA